MGLIEHKFVCWKLFLWLLHELEGNSQKQVGETVNKQGKVKRQPFPALCIWLSAFSQWTPTPRAARLLAVYEFVPRLHVAVSLEEAVVDDCLQAILTLPCSSQLMWKDCVELSQGKALSCWETEGRHQRTVTDSNNLNSVKTRGNRKLLRSVNHEHTKINLLWSSSLRS